MPNNRQNPDIEELLRILTTRVYRNQKQVRVPGPNGFRVVSHQVDDTGIGPNSETDTRVSDDRFIMDCGHDFRGMLGRCHYCDALVCDQCIKLCCCCGLAICPVHTVTGNFDGKQKFYCRSCAEEISRSLKLRALAGKVLSFFFE